MSCPDPESPRLPDGMRDLDALCCGCGSPELFFQAALAILEHFATEHDKRDYRWIYADQFRYLAVNALDHAGMIEHGSSVAGSWLTDAGKEALAFLREHGVTWNEGQRWIDSDGVTHGHTA